jgi:hypothetical protein
LVAAGLLIVGSTVIEGLACGRWRAAHGIAAALASLKLSPNLGDWQYAAGPATLGTAPAVVEWTYRRPHPERTAHLFLVAGDRRALAAHRPESCYPQTSLRVEGKPGERSVAADNLQAAVRTAALWREEPTGRRRWRAVWTTCDGGNWTAGAPGRPGARQFKLYGFAEEPAAQPAEGEHLLDLLRRILPELNEMLTAEPPNSHES